MAHEGAKTIRQLRQAHGWTPEQVARHVRVAEITVERWGVAVRVLHRVKRLGHAAPGRCAPAARGEWALAGGDQVGEPAAGVPQAWRVAHRG